MKDFGTPLAEPSAPADDATAWRQKSPILRKAHALAEGSVAEARRVLRRGAIRALPPVP